MVSELPPWVLKYMEIQRKSTKTQPEHPPWAGPGPGPQGGGVLGGVLLVFCVFPCILVPGEAILMPILVDIATLPKLVQFSDYDL